MNPPSSNPEPLQIGLGRLSAPGRRASRQKAARQLLDQALAAVDTGHTPVRCFLLLATADWCNEKGVSLPAQIRKQCKDRLGYDVSLIGGSLASLFYLDGKTADEDAFIEHGAILVAFCSHDFWVSVEALDTPHRDGGTGRFERVKQLADDLLENAGTRLGASAARHLLVFSPGIFLDQQGNQVYQDNELHEEIVSAFDYRYRVVGAAAADALEPTVGYQFANDSCMKSGLAVGLVETDLASGTMMGHGFSPVPDKYVVVDALADGEEVGYELAVLDGEPASERLEKLCGDLASLNQRIFFGLPNGPDHHILCAFEKKGNRRESVRLNRKVRRGDRLCLLQTSAQDLETAAQSTTDTAVTASGAPEESLRLICDITCSARLELYAKLGRDWKNVTKALQQRYPCVPLIGGLGAGEFGVDRWRRAQANNVTFWVNCIASSYGKQDIVRKLSRDLLLAANNLRDCQKPQEVMMSALRGGCDAGAIGGQVCIVDQGVGRILGLDLGYAYSAPLSGIDWARVAAITNRPVAQVPSGGNFGVEFPGDLLKYSISLASNCDSSIVPRIEEQDDILTLITRSRYAIFVEDSADPIYHCNKEAIATGNIKTFLAIPLLGSRDTVIATLQLSLPERTLDRESFTLWVDYAKEFAAALERAEEQHEREAIQALSSLAIKLLQTPPSLDQSPHENWCIEYLHAVSEHLGVDDTHIRLHKDGPCGEEYHLLAAVGRLAALRKSARPITRPGAGEGSCDLTLLAGGGVITHTRTETKQHNKNVRPIQDSGKLGQDFMNELDKLEATAMLPLKYENKILGSLVLDSRYSYFFIGRRARLAHAAAALCGAILRGKMDAYDRETQNREKANTAKAMRDAFEDVAHQIKSPLSEATRRVERVADIISDPVLRREFDTVASMLQRAELSARLVGLFSKLARREPINVRGTPHGPINLTDLAETICNNQRPRISAQRNINIECDKESFRSHAPQELSIDADLLTQALTNLVDNAIKYSYRNATVRVFGSKSKWGDFLIGVSNKGIPILPHEVALVKQRNWRGKAALASVAEGNGIGLWIVDHIIRAMGGELLVLPTRAIDGINEVRLVFPQRS